jgi:hypothetical protein
MAPWYCTRVRRVERLLRAVERAPHVIAPLITKTVSPRRVVFSASEEVRRTTAPPPRVEIGESSLPPEASAIPEAAALMNG